MNDVISRCARSGGSNSLAMQCGLISMVCTRAYVHRNRASHCVDFHSATQNGLGEFQGKIRMNVSILAAEYGMIGHLCDLLLALPIHLSKDKGPFSYFNFHMQVTSGATKFAHVALALYFDDIAFLYALGNIHFDRRALP